MAEHTTSDPLASKAVEFQATAEAYYSIAVEKVKDVRYVAGFVSIAQLAFTDGNVTGCQAVENSSVLLISTYFNVVQLVFCYMCVLPMLVTSCQEYNDILFCF